MAKEIRFYDDDGYLYPQAMLNGIDETNIIADVDVAINQTYTCEEDCFIVFNSDQVSGGIYINNVFIGAFNNYVVSHYSLFIKKGDILSFGNSAQHIKVFGIKH